MKIYAKTGIYCHFCGAELHLIEDIYYNDFDGDIIKDVDHYFECNNCGCEFETTDVYTEKIEKIIGDTI